ncbi:inositol-3-phosphate synthase [Humisphaera borealis]|uniref:Inositol-3-phosphate synthase n=1 Tax=Humisphaera borealis TaxID=2807512 RepID=A0A7M2X126_9BACT|nr:inositol-3-phosphate synthase [Humisphaera borealis]QOV91385.1 inositol-3-phosphate synthase [Humisphaera borealis]
MSRIRLAIAGIGNCASSLVQGIAHYRAVRGTDRQDIGLMHPALGGLRVEDIEVVAAFDIDSRKVGQSLETALFSPPNNTKVFCNDIGKSGVTVQMGEVLDGVAAHMADYPLSQRFDVASAKAVDPARVLRDSGADILVSYMPVGSQKATEYYAQAALDAKVGFVNCVPCFVVSDPKWAAKFTAAGLPCVGDDIKAQVGATITHRTLARLFVDRGVDIDCTYQMNTGGNTDFLNMLNRDRLSSKKISKTEAVQSQLDVPLPPDQIHIGPSDYVPFLKDNKVCFIRMEGNGFGGVPLNLELRLSVEDSPNSAAVVVDAIRCCKLAKDAGIAGPLEVASAWCMKHPPKQMPDREAKLALEEFVSDAVAKVRGNAVGVGR